MSTPAPNGSLSTAEVAAALGVARTTLGDWIRQGIATPSVQRARKQGSPALWSPRDVAVLRQARDLLALLARWGAPAGLADALRLVRGAGDSCYVAVGRERALIVRRSTPASEVARKVGAPFLLLQPTSYTAAPEVPVPAAAAVP